MLELVHMIILATLQGLTEFLPVSSSGHLVLTQHLLGTREGDIFFDIILHLGTLGSVLVVYRREIVRLLRFDSLSLRYILALVVGTIPAVIVGLVFRDSIESLFHSPVFAAGGLLLTAGFLFSTRYSTSDTAGLSEPWEPQAPDLSKALLIGCGQAFAILPGISRSGSTIAASLWLRVPRAEAARFSFLLSIPAICGALVLQLSDGVAPGANWTWMILSALVAFGVGLLALRWTALAVVQDHFWKFSVYCVVVGAVALVVLL
ncbi:MAG: undecaprenyl-diphosphate phosphatase [Candidatus Krumholzibacteria bacterium]|nr:undecaprenyl-diphosphate phosphatase [Candidatus Krumholzibacteria bacterium]